MRLKLYMDENIPYAIARPLQQKGVDVLTCQDADLRSASDAEQLAYATAEGHTIVTGDADFLSLDVE